ncbi:MAG: OmpA family protein [Bacteriovoracaceae bacterium]|nr:OmpA family protein [Bacteriovoracaceae bacterium]
MRIKIALVILFVFIVKTKVYSNVIGTDAQNFNPITNGIDFVTVHSSKTLEQGIVNAGIFFNYAVNTFPVFRTGTGAANQTTAINDTLTAGDFNIGLGLMKNWEIGLSFPVIYNQTVENSLNLGRFENSGITEVRVNTKYRFAGNDFWGLAAILTVNFNKIENNPYVGEDPGPIVNIEVAVNTEISDINIAFNVGHRWRSPGTKIPGIGIDPIPNQVISSVAAAYRFASIDTNIIFELLSAIPSQETANATDRELSAYEMLLGAKHDVNTNTSLHVGMGAEITHGTATPDWRVYAGMNYAFGPVFGKKGVTVISVESDDNGYSPEVISLTDLKFNFGKTIIADESIIELEELVNTLRADAKLIKKIEIEGYTDSVGSANYNQKLSQGRSDTIKKFLVDNLGIDADQIVSTGYGEEFPIADNANYQGRATNRRVNLKIFK